MKRNGEAGHFKSKPVDGHLRHEIVEGEIAAPENDAMSSLASAARDMLQRRRSRFQGSTLPAAMPASSEIAPRNDGRNSATASR